MKTLITLLLGILLAATVSQAQVEITSTDNFNTRDQMLLANEINESGEPFAEALGYDLDLLDPMVLNDPDSISYTLGIENYEYSRYQLGTVISRSGIGLHMMWSPMIMQMAAMEPPGFDGSMTGTPNGFNEDDELIKNIMHFAMLSNGMAPMHPWPQFAEFENGDPHLPQPVADDFQMDFSSLRWDRSLMDKTFNLGAMGQTLMKQYLWAQDMLGTFHDGDEEEVVPTGSNSPDSTGSPHFDPNNNIYYGGDNTDGFIGQILTAEAINKTLFLINSLAYDGTDLGMVDPATYNPANGIQFFPHRIAVTESPVADGLPPKASSLQVTDASSDLFDQLSYLWGTLSFKNMMDPDNNSDEPHWAFRTEEGNNLATYTPFNFAVIAGGLREAALVGGHTEAAAIYTRFFKKVANVMQLAEFDPSGETGNDSDGDGIPFLPEQPDQLAPVFAAEAQLDFTVTGIDDRISLNEADVAIYPNPASENATIGFTIEKASNVSVEAVDFTGKKVQTILNRQLPQGQFKASWNVNDLPGGIYFIRITVGASAVLTKKVVVM